MSSIIEPLVSITHSEHSTALHQLFDFKVLFIIDKSEDVWVREVSSRLTKLIEGCDPETDITLQITNDPSRSKAEPGTTWSRLKKTKYGLWTSYRIAKYEKKGKPGGTKLFLLTHEDTTKNHEGTIHFPRIGSGS